MHALDKSTVWSIFQHNGKKTKTQKSKKKSQKPKKAPHLTYSRLCGNRMKEEKIQEETINKTAWHVVKDTQRE